MLNAHVCWQTLACIVQNLHNYGACYASDAAVSLILLLLLLQRLHR